MVYVLGVLMLLLALAGIAIVVFCIRQILSDEESKLPLFFRAMVPTGLNKVMAGFGAASGLALAILCGWSAYKAFTGG